MKPLVKAVVVLLGFAIFFGTASAQFSRKEDAIKYRQSVMFIIGQLFSRLGAMVKGKQPYDQKQFADNAAIVNTLAALPWEAFLVADSDRGKTTMKSSVLQNPDEFKAESRKFLAEVGKLLSAATGDDLNAVKGQFGAVAKSCKSCHSQFRK